MFLCADHRICTSPPLLCLPRRSIVAELPVRKRKKSTAAMGCRAIDEEVWYASRAAELLSISNRYVMCADGR